MSLTLKTTSWIPVVVGLILADQISKAWIMTYWRDYEVVAILPFFNLVLVYNTGAAFSFLADASGWQHYFFVTIALLASVFLLYLITHAQTSLERFSLALILSGALGNLIDRLRLGKVVDFLDFHAYGYHFPAFNVADSCITVGVVLLIASSWRFGKQSSNINSLL